MTKCKGKRQEEEGSIRSRSMRNARPIIDFLLFLSLQHNEIDLNAHIFRRLSRKQFASSARGWLSLAFNCLPCSPHERASPVGCVFVFILGPIDKSIFCSPALRSVRPFDFTIRFVGQASLRFQCGYFFVHWKIVLVKIAPFLIAH